MIWKRYSRVTFITRSVLLKFHINHKTRLPMYFPPVFRFFFFVCSIRYYCKNGGAYTGACFVSSRCEIRETLSRLCYTTRCGRLAFAFECKIGHVFVINNIRLDGEIINLCKSCCLSKGLYRLGVGENVNVIIRLKYYRNTSLKYSIKKIK